MEHPFTEVQQQHQQGNDLSGPRSNIANDAMRQHSNSILAAYPFVLPSEILLAILDNLTVSQLLGCQLVSLHFRAVTRVVLMDRLGGQFLGMHKRKQQQSKECSVCQQQSARRNVRDLPPLPHHHHPSSGQRFSSSIHGGSQNHLSEQQYHQSQQHSHHDHHQHHHHLYQHQSMEGLSQHPQTDLHIHQQSHSYDIPALLHTPLSPIQQREQRFSSPTSRRQDAGYVAPGTIALFLFPYHDHTPTGWQEHQSVHLRCTSIDREQEQLIFSPITPESGDTLTFSTNSWNLPPTTSSSLGFFSAVGAETRAGAHLRYESYADDTTQGSYKSPATGLDLFDYSTGQPRRANESVTSASMKGKGAHLVDALSSYSFTDQFLVIKSPDTVSTSHASSNSFSTSPNSPSLFSASSSPLSSIASANSSTSSLSSVSSTSSLCSSSASPSSSSSLSASPSALPVPFWPTVNDKGGERYSVIGIKYGDWPEDPQSTSRWWGGGLNTSMVQRPMIFLPWAASSGGQGSVADFHQRLMRKHEQQRQDERELQANHKIMGHTARKHEYDNEQWCHHHHYHRSRAAKDHPLNSKGKQAVQSESRYSSSEARVRGGEDGEDSEEMGCSRIHQHHMFLSYIAAFNSFKAAAEDETVADFRAGHDIIPMARAGSKYLSIDYGAKITESKKCQFCLSSPCKANLEIQVKFAQVRVSLDWILSGFVPDHIKRPRSPVLHGSPSNSA
ncbi:hypothetical protein EDD11_008138 [Mortierella claussenii]|nr:hypothetical protein EDD11_008138 [Mortierella claussenii]